ncbi:amidase [Mesorhizobium sp. L-8-3]|uniref:amidase n=1 Tax=Mesorhizobium sp. L-8-3 TaxID=2744522 RepID=UPI0019277BE0|nr:amidase [Mesorhizobium sp. L-8-3]BCH20278.1 amidase [Mesorhizobium sp. L-8-3]
MLRADRSLHQIAGDLREGRLTAQALMEEAAERHRATEGRLNAYKTWAGERARLHAQAADMLLGSGVDLGPLMGMPVSVKDLYGVPGLPVFAGTDTAFPESWTNPGPLVRRLQGQLGIVTGKTHTVEFAFGGLGVNAHWGSPVNPWSAPGEPRAPGGSSSGAGVSLGQGSALVALGTDTAGSVRIPASLTGQVALKTTHGRWSGEGIVPLSPSLDTPGILCRTVEDLAFAFAALDGSADKPAPPRSVDGLRIGVPRNFFWDEADASIVEITEAALRKLESKGARLVPLELPGCDEVIAVFQQGGLAASELHAFLNARFPERIARLDPVVRMRVAGADSVTAAEYLRRRAVLAENGQRSRQAFDHCDVLMTPTVPISPPLLSELQDAETYRRANMLVLRNTAIANLFGWCAMSLPAGLDANAMPVGLQLIGPPLYEPGLIAAGLATEAVLGRAADLLGQVPLSR